MVKTARCCSAGPFLFRLEAMYAKDFARSIGVASHGTQRFPNKLYQPADNRHECVQSAALDRDDSDRQNGDVGPCSVLCKGHPNGVIVPVLK